MKCSKYALMMTFDLICHSGCRLTSEWSTPYSLLETQSRISGGFGCLELVLYGIRELA